MEPEEIGAFEAKTRLSELLERVREGRVYRITKRGVPVAELRPIEGSTRRLVPGVDRGRGIWMSDDFDAPLPDFEEYM
jgi:prevent-host-death family protein